METGLIVLHHKQDVLSDARGDSSVVTYLQVKSGNAELEKYQQ